MVINSVEVRTSWDPFQLKTLSWQWRKRKNPRFEFSTITSLTHRRDSTNSMDVQETRHGSKLSEVGKLRF